MVWRDELDDDVREELLKADNWQGAHVQAPVWIYIFADPTPRRPRSSRRARIQLLDVGASIPAYGWSKTRILDAIERAVETPAGMAGIHELLHDLPAEAAGMVAYAETVGACYGAVLAAVDQGLGTCLHMIAKPTMAERVKELLKVPEHWVPVWLQLVGHSAEGAAAGGQRPRFDFETLFFEGNVETPFRRDPEVVREMEEAKLLQARAAAGPLGRAPVPRPHVRLPRGSLTI